MVIVWRKFEFYLLLFDARVKSHSNSGGIRAACLTLYTRTAIQSIQRTFHSREQLIDYNHYFLSNHSGNCSEGIFLRTVEQQANRAIEMIME